MHRLDDRLAARLKRARPAAAAESLRMQLTRKELLSGKPVQLGRYVLGRRLGEGAMGAVYEAFDPETGDTVALKTLRQPSHQATDLLKREFRGLADLVHPNLVRFYELNLDGDASYLTMELVSGKDLLVHLWGTEHPHVPLATPPLDVPRIYAALRQLARGLGALHRAGKVHRDVKPSNIMVTDAGRVVLLDFGLVGTAQHSAAADASFDGGIVGTPLYMAPEQLACSAVSAAADWFSVGAVLYHAVTGHAPCEGESVEGLRARRACEPAPRPSDERSDVPSALDDLVHQLLQPDPQRRPRMPQLLRLLGDSEALELKDTPSNDHGGSALFGRAHELSVLDALLEASGRAPVVLGVTGPTGVGKSALLRHFFERHGEQGWFLRVRCHERESIPFKVLDGLIEALTRRLRDTPVAVSAPLMPRHIHALARHFPRLSKLEVVQGAPRAYDKGESRRELWRRAMMALQELLARIGDRGPLVVWVDNLQWGDSESVALLRRLLRSRDSLRGLFVGTYTGPSEVMDAYLERLAHDAERFRLPLQVRTMALSPLGMGEALQLAEHLIADEHRAAAPLIAQEGAGNPLITKRLAAHVNADAGVAGATRSTFDEMVEEQVAALSPAARNILRVIAIAGRPIDQRLAMLAARCEGGVDQAFAELREADLIRTQGSRERGLVEIDHDRLARAVMLSMTPDTIRGLHRQLADTLISVGAEPPERTAMHLRKAGEPAAAARHLVQSAERAANNLAFERAAALYRMAFQCGLDDVRVEGALAEALRNSGFALEAAHAYERAAADPALNADARLELRRRAAQELLFSGHLDMSVGPLPEILRELGLRLPGLRFSAIVGLLVSRCYLRLRGLGYRRRPVQDIPAREIARADTVWMIGQGMMIVDPIRGNNLLNRNVRFSLCCGDPGRVARALSLEAATVAWSGASAARRAEQLLFAARKAAAEAEDPVTDALVRLGSAVVAFFVGEPIRSIREAQTVERLLRERCTGVVWELHSCCITLLSCQMQLGLWREFAEACEHALGEAVSCGNLFREVGLRHHSHLARLVRDDVPGARAEIEAVSRAWPYKRFDTMHLTLVAGPARVHLYEGKAVEACDHLDRMWPALRRSFMLRARVIMVEAVWLRGRAAATAYTQTGQRRYRRRALWAARLLIRQSAYGAEPAALTLRAAVARRDGREDRAQSLLVRAESLYDNARSESFMLLTRYQRALGLPGAEGRELAQESLEALARLGIERPALFARIYVPAAVEESA